MYLWGKVIDKGLFVLNIAEVMHNQVPPLEELGFLLLISMTFRINIVEKLWFNHVISLC